VALAFLGGAIAGIIAGARQLFEPTVRNDAIAHIQARVNAYWEHVKREEKTA